nr:UbiA family prenyltransferase [uncultured Rhodopila sp.]
MPTGARLSTLDNGRPPLAVDLDGTLALSDTLHEALIGMAAHSPRRAVRLATSLRTGKAAFKRTVAESVRFDPANLPYNQDLLAFLRAERASGRRIGLFTAADQSIADAVAAHLQLFDVVRGSDGTINLSGVAKADAIEAALGPSFTYAGNDVVDLPIFARAANVVLVGPVQRLARMLPPDAKIEATFPLPKARVEVWANALRLQHWSKNALVFVAPILSGQHAALWLSIPLFVLFGVLSSGTYLLNDLADLAADRAHPKKRFRPLSRGAIPARDGVIVAFAMIAGSLSAAALLLPLGCLVALFAYLLITILYSALLKRIAMVDVSVLAGLFTLRVVAGGMLVTTMLSPWLLTFSMLFFLGLATIKRYAELHRVGSTMVNGGIARGYSQLDKPILLATGISTGISSIVIFMIYLINEQYPQAIYSRPDMLWGIMPILLVWTLRLWHLAVNGGMSEDPVLFALKDRFSLAMGGIILLILIAARL